MSYHVKMLLFRPHMGCFAFNTTQQKHILPIILCKYPTSSQALKFHCLCHSLPCLPPKHTRTCFTNTHAKFSATRHESAAKTANLRTRKENGSGFYSWTLEGKRVVTKRVNNIVRPEPVEEKTEKLLRRGKNAKKDTNAGKRRERSSRKSLESKGGQVVDDGEMANKIKRGGDSLVEDKKAGKRSKKGEAVDASGVGLKFSFDRCSKSGDVIGAIELYDSTRGKGIKMGQYHYGVLLYLCSSAAVGVVQPAKSGSVNASRELDVLNESNEGLKALMELGESGIGGMEMDFRENDDSQRCSDIGRESKKIDAIEVNSNGSLDGLDTTSLDEKENLAMFSSGYRESVSKHVDGRNVQSEGNDSNNHGNGGIQVSEETRKYALRRGFEIYEQMCVEKVPANEAILTAVARMAMSVGNGDMAFDMVKQMKQLGINPRLRSYVPALSVFCSAGDVEKAFAVERHMLEHDVYPEQPELEALLRLSVEAGKGDKVYYVLHKLRTTVGKVSPSAASVIIRWFKSKAASSVGRAKWDPKVIKEAIGNGGGGWHGQGWLGKGEWNISNTMVGPDGFCKCCGEKLAIVDLDPAETQNFAESVASIAIKGEKDSSFQKFQKWLDYYGPFEAVVDGANVGTYRDRRFMPYKVNAIVNGIRYKLSSKKCPLIILHNRRTFGQKMNEQANKALVEKWKNAGALYTTPTGSNDDWYWLYAAIKFKCLLVTNDEMRDHKFQLLGNDFFPKWKERHQVRFSFSKSGLAFHMPPSCSVVIQESEKGHWHIPIETGHDYQTERPWLCVTRTNFSKAK
ncbi:hypothetical protein Tsubulata_031802 [Turnera subulata]|uniref:ribonuclease P n=1 Tax=Turnera subulata TaxID=218843 RepID=A0A9Q0JRS8_9ROSI|nr:hypothetical protein Tsubulata_031802 [Turnera subulata]